MSYLSDNKNFFDHLILIEFEQILVKRLHKSSTIFIFTILLQYKGGMEKSTSYN